MNDKPNGVPAPLLLIDDNTLIGDLASKLIQKAKSQAQEANIMEIFVYTNIENLYQ